VSTEDHSFLSDFFATQKITIEKCLAPTGGCTKRGIRAHSIQNSRVMQLIHDKNKVVMMRSRVDKRGLRVELELVGRNQASTFAGLCSLHDAEIFRPIDTEDFNPRSQQHLFLIAYRSVYREFHSIMEGAVRLQSLFVKAVEDGKVSAHEQSPVMLIATEGLLRSYSFYGYKTAHFDIPYLRAAFDAVEHDVVIFEDQAPTIAASTFNSLEPIITPGGFVGIIINVIPLPGRRMVVVFSYAASEASKARTFLDRILSATGERQKYELSKHLLAVTENFALNPRFVASWAKERRQAVTAAFQRTINVANPDVGENPNFLLF
jgi:hypothetical protein